MTTRQLNALLGAIPPLAWAITTAVAVASALIFTPRAQLSGLQVEMAQVRTVLAEHSGKIELTEKIVRALGKKACWESTPEQRAFLDLPCTDLLQRDAPMRQR